MAKMIPAQIDDAVRSSAERRIFDLLATDPDTRDWTVLHSLGLARRETGPFGEIDFVVMVPGQGVICMEVKGGRVSCESGKWRTMDRYGRTNELGQSPFAQARGGMFALRKSIIGHFGEHSPEASCPIAFAVAFPDVVCPPTNPEFTRSDVIDSVDLRRPISASITKVVRPQLGADLYRRRVGFATPSNLKSIRAYLRPDFDFVVARSVSLSRTESRLLGLTEEQYERLDNLEDNARCLFEGAAGTGKTLLALEYARRADRDGSKVLLVCFNRLLGNWLQELTEGTGITAGTWHETLKRLIVASSAGEEFLGHERKAAEGDDLGTLFNELYPFYGEIALEEMDAPFDVLVVDEAQDLVDITTLDLLTLAVRGGLAGGRWGIFGDFTRQALYSTSSEPIEDLSRYVEHFVRARLTVNCRNTRKIAGETAIIGGFISPPYRLGQEAGMPVEHRYWKTESGLLRSITATVRRLVADGVSVDDMVILSPRRLENSALAGVEEICDIPLVDCSRSLVTYGDCVRFSTIHSFKGLESQIVIIIDIDEVDDDMSQALLYVGMSRARSLLVMMIHERARSSIDARIRAALQKEIEI